MCLMSASCRAGNSLCLTAGRTAAPALALQLSRSESPFHVVHRAVTLEDRGYVSQVGDTSPSVQHLGPVNG